MWKVEYVDMGLRTLEADTFRLLRDVLDISAAAVERKMKLLIKARGFVDTRATLNSVHITPNRDLVRDIGPTTEYAIYGEMGYMQTHAWGRKMHNPIWHPGLFFARDSLEYIRPSFLKACEAALKRLGK